MNIMAFQITVSLFFKLTSKKTPKLHSTGPLWGESTGHWWISPHKGIAKTEQERYDFVTKSMQQYQNDKDIAS